MHVETTFLIPVLLYTIGTIAAIILVLVVAWRIMKAQEATASALQQIADTLAQRSGPSA